MLTPRARRAIIVTSSLGLGVAVSNKWNSNSISTLSEFYDYAKDCLKELSAVSQLNTASSAAPYSDRRERLGLPSSIPSLSPQDIANRIRQACKGSTTVVNVNQERVKSYHTAQYNANNPLEDTFAVKTDLHSVTGALFGVFDGHSGSAASNFCARELPDYLDYFASTQNKDIIDPQAILHADIHFRSFALLDRIEGMHSGACLLVTHIGGNTVRTASAGDCRAVLGRKRTKEQIKINNNIGHEGIDIPSTAFYSDEWRTRDYDPVELSVVHQIDRNERERTRLLSQHVNEEDVLSNSRVKGSLQPTRGFGDAQYKDKRSFDLWPRSTNKVNWTPPYTTAEPDITQYTLTPQDEFIVLGSDGIFDELSSEAVVERVGQFLKDPKIRERHEDNCASYLIECALKTAGEYMVGRTQTPEWPLSAILSLPQHLRRRNHDDMTALVIFLSPPEDPSLAAKYPRGVRKAGGPPTPPYTLRRLQKLHQKKDMRAMTNTALSFENNNNNNNNNINGDNTTTDVEGQGGQVDKDGRDKEGMITISPEVWKYSHEDIVRLATSRPKNKSWFGRIYDWFKS